MSRSFAKLALIGGTLALALTPVAAEAGNKKPPKTCKKASKKKKCQPVVKQGRMTGHGHQFDVNGFSKVQWEFRNTVCNSDRFPDLKVEFGGNKFVLTEYSSGPICFTLNPPTSREGNPVAGFDSFRGTGTGTLNGLPGAGITFQFTDLGEPGRGDLADFTITSPDGGIAYSGGAIDGGNHQAHRK